jgi:hypothetical protein
MFRTNRPDGEPIVIEDAVVELLADKVAERLRSQLLLDEKRIAALAIIEMQTLLYREVGKGFLNKLWKLIGIVIVGAGMYLAQKGFITFNK